MNQAHGWRKEVLAEIRDLKQEVKTVAKELHQVNAQLTTLKIRVAGVSATVAILVTIITALISK